LTFVKRIDSTTKRMGRGKKKRTGPTSTSGGKKLN